MNLDLVSKQFSAAHEQEVVRVKMRDIRISDFFILTTGGQLYTKDLNPRGQMFAEQWFEDYRRWAVTSLQSDEFDDWDKYDQAAKWLMPRLVRRFRSKPRWRFWNTKRS